jgi:hypothetical protein
MQLGAGIWFNPVRIHVNFVVDELALMQGFVRVSLVSSAKHHCSIAPNSSIVAP